jgi:hAT family C-terminal dimerisation region
MEWHCRDIWEREYSHRASKEDYTEPTDAFEAWRNRIRKQEQLSGDEFSRYCPIGAGIATLDLKTMSPIKWWDVLGQQFPSIRQWAFDTLACLATSCKCERVFSSTKRLITPDRNSLGDELVEALECLKAWWDNGLIERHWKMYTRYLSYSSINPISSVSAFPIRKVLYPLVQRRPACWERWSPHHTCLAGTCSNQTFRGICHGFCWVIGMVC